MPLLACGLLSAVVTADDEAVRPLFETQPNVVTESLEPLLAWFGAEAAYEEAAGLNASYIPAVFYTPEQGLGVGLLYVGLYGNSYGGTVQPSSLIANPYISNNGSVGLSLENHHFFDRGDRRLHLDLSVYRDAAVYYGVGYRQGQHDDNKRDYSERALTLEASWINRVQGDLFWGVGLDLHSVSPDDIELAGRDGIAAELDSNTSYGAFVSGLYDSRDNLIGPTQGTLLQAQVGAYFDASNDASFGQYRLTASHYRSLKPLPGLLAWQVQADLTSGEVPWNRLPDLGGDDAMRGYMLGRYRDEQMMMAQMEYRLPVYWRLGMVFWGAAGSVAGEVSQLWDDTLYSYGTGLRFKIKDKVNVRADLGFGEHEATFYFHVNEVF
ncbi:BamA/TamA family outer membrane protein [Ferrimonas pelagia]|uniref:BamA/TamA family outer membrane protein n=1 Tax=Ferrimonas pelagia TaxID=1177826 RepID=A0ABP9EFE4_9GAMM